MSEAAPAFSFYAKDFMLGTINMSLAARGAYITLLAYQWDHGSVPGDPIEIGRICGCTKAQAAKAWTAIVQKFRPGPDGTWHNARLEQQRSKQAAYRDQQRQKGLASARAREREREGNRGSPPVDQSVASRLEPIVNFPSSVSVSDPVPSEPLRRPRGQPPMALGLRRLKFWRWMADAFFEKLGSHAEDFDLTAWLQDVDEHETRVITGDWWAYWLPLFETEVRRRGLPLTVSTTSRRLIETTPEEDGAAVLELLRKDRAR